MLTTALCAGNVNRILWHGTIPFRPCLPRSMMKARKKQSPRTNRHSPGASRRMRWWETSLNLRAGVDGCMPRRAQASVGDICYHVINRGNAQIEVFHKDSDYQTFVELIGLACQPIPMRLLAYCVMSNHFHLASVASFGQRPRPLDAMAFDGSRAALSSALPPAT